MIVFYYLFLWLYRGGVMIASFFNPKAQLFLKGRVNVLGKLRKDMKKVTGRTIWMHCSSLGEYEQGKPVLKKMLNTHPDLTPVVSFFSPSGYEIVKKKNEFSNVYYLPMDSFVNARLWMKLVKPSLVLWVKYEYWYFYLEAIRHKKIPLLMISGIYRRNQPFFRWYGGLYRKMLKCFAHFFVQNQSSKRYLSTIINKENITVSGDTRCDRVLEIAAGFQAIKPVESFIKNSRVVVCGSTWEADEAVWIHYAKEHPEIKFVIAPHQIDRDNIVSLTKRFENSIAFSEWEKISHDSQHPEFNCLIIDNVGMLSRLYYYADIAYVGGGFGDEGLHNILEAAVYGKPVLFGPYISKNFEAYEMIDARGAFSISSAIELEKEVDMLFTDEKLLDKSGKNAFQYVLKNAGASDIIMEYLNKKGFL